MKTNFTEIIRQIRLNLEQEMILKFQQSKINQKKRRNINSNENNFTEIIIRRRLSLAQEIQSFDRRKKITQK